MAPKGSKNLVPNIVWELYYYPIYPKPLNRGLGSGVEGLGFRCRENYSKLYRNTQTRLLHKVLHHSR